jgi:hypothetical protein
MSSKTSAGNSAERAKASALRPPGIADPIELEWRTRGNHGDPFMTAKRPKPRTSVRSEDEAGREGKSERCVVAMNAGNAAGAKAAR